MNFSERLNAFFKATGIKKNDLPELIGISRGMLFNYLAGRNEPSAAFFQNLKKAFPWVNIEWLITGEGEMEAHPEKTREEAEDQVLMDQDLQKALQRDPRIAKIAIMLGNMSVSDIEEVFRKSEERLEIHKLKSEIKTLKKKVGERS